MATKNTALAMYATTFLAGSFLVLANSQDITANVVGASGPTALFSEIVGMVVLIASAALFMVTLNLEHTVEKEKHHYKGHAHQDPVYEDLKAEHTKYDSKDAAKE